MITFVYDPMALTRGVPDGECEHTVRVLLQTGYEGDWIVSSANIVYAVRAMVKRGEVRPDQVQFSFREKILPVDLDGRLKEWPVGFCDYEERWLRELI